MFRSGSELDGDVDDNEVSTIKSKAFSDTNSSWLKMMNGNEEDEDGDDLGSDAGDDEPLDDEFDVANASDSDDVDDDEELDEDGGKLLKIEKQSRRLDKAKAAERFD
jgi:hypothetical protein